MNNRDFQLGIICGGPSGERGISLNSARSVLDHLGHLDIYVYYVNPQLEVFFLDSTHLYSNTPEDFDFKIREVATLLSEKEWVGCLQEHDMVFPLIHGEYGEDGVLQDFLAKNNIAYVGSNGDVCAKMFYKDRAMETLSKAGYPVLPMCHATKDLWPDFLDKHHKMVVKPQAGGSSIGVSVVKTYEEAGKAIEGLEGQHPLCEAYCEGVEFTVVVLASMKGPVALIPTEIEIDVPGAVFDYRRKYLPTSNTRWYCPSRFSQIMIGRIRQQAEDIFSLFGMEDFVRIDGWVIDGRVIFSDINPISGMEQNSFIFLQASRIGMTHTDLLMYILQHSAKRLGRRLPIEPLEHSHREVLPVLFGGDTAERQVSLMSGTNVWLKLRGSLRYVPQPYLLDMNMQIWPLGYTYCLNHTVEEIMDNVVHAQSLRMQMQPWFFNIRQLLGLAHIDMIGVYPVSEPMSLEVFAKHWEGRQVFLALHGGMGEDGRIQTLLAEYAIKHNGSLAEASRLGMDKYLFAQAVNDANILGVEALNKHCVQSTDQWEDLQGYSQGPMVIKPRDQGCSWGVAVLRTQEDYTAYCRHKDAGVSYIVERYIATDTVKFDGQGLIHIKESGWIELTAVVFEEGGEYVAMYPSMTIAQDAILSVEEKFQGGTGMNITPPPVSMVPPQQLLGIRERLANIAQKLGVGHYVRFDLFYHVESHAIILIEMNTLPALTPSTVLYHQMLATNYAKTPFHGLERLIANIA